MSVSPRRSSWPRGLRRGFPAGKRVQLAAVGQDRAPEIFEVVDMQLGRVALRRAGQVLSIAADGSATLVAKAPGADESFQWIETPGGDLVLLALATHRYLRIDPATNKVIAIEISIAAIESAMRSAG